MDDITQFLFIFVILLFVILIGFLAFTGYTRAKGRIESQKSQIQKLTASLQTEELHRRSRDVELSKLQNQIKQIETSEIINVKKQKFLNMPNISFHYADKERLEAFCNDYFKEPTIESLVSELTGEVNTQVKGGIPQFIESKIGSKDIGKWISTIKTPDTSLSGTFLRYQREIIKSGQATLGIEEVEIELTDLQEFDEAIKNLSQRFDFQIPIEIVDEQRKSLKEKAAEKTIRKLETASGWVLIEGGFEIELQDDLYKFTYMHPVNDYITQKESVTITTSIPPNTLEAHVSGNYKQSIGQTIPLKIYGQVWHPVNRKAGTWDLKLTPFAIYN